MNAKEYLGQAYRLDHRIDCKLRQSEGLRDLATKATASIHAERVSGTKQRSLMENAIVKLIDLEHEINADIDKLVDLKRKIIDVIARVENPDYQVLLENRYLNFMTWEEISELMGFTPRNIYYLHGKALKVVQQVLTLHCFSHSTGDII